MWPRVSSRWPHEKPISDLHVWYQEIGASFRNFDRQHNVALATKLRRQEIWAIIRNFDQQHHIALATRFWCQEIWVSHRYLNFQHRVTLLTRVWQVLPTRPYRTTQEDDMDTRSTNGNDKYYDSSVPGSYSEISGYVKNIKNQKNRKLGHCHKIQSPYTNLLDWISNADKQL